jgi:hypothetical protein
MRPKRSPCPRSVESGEEQRYLGSGRSWRSRWRRCPHPPLQGAEANAGEWENCQIHGGSVLGFIRLVDGSMRGVGARRSWMDAEARGGKVNWAREEWWIEVGRGIRSKPKNLEHIRLNRQINRDGATSTLRHQSLKQTEEPWSRDRRWWRGRGSGVTAHEGAVRAEEDVRTLGRVMMLT